MGGILAFHRVHRPLRKEFASETGSIAPEHFRRLVRTLIDRGYDILSLSELIKRLSSGEDSASKFVCLTFDDGYVDTYTAAYAICREYHVPMTVFLMTGAIRRQ